MICDFAEFYHIYDYGLLPVDTVATLCFGLGENSRVQMAMANAKVSPKTILLGMIADRLGGLMKGLGMIDEFESIASSFYEKEEKPGEYKTFQSGEDFEKAWHKLGG